MSVLAGCMSVWMALAGGAAPGDGSAGDDPGRSRYYQALQQVRAGNPRGGLEALAGLVEHHADSAFADDAMLEMARILEEELDQPARALATYRELLQRFPDSRMARRARARVEFLSSHLDAGEQALNTYRDILEHGATRPVDESIRRMRRLLDEHPDFSLAPRALHWMASLLVRARRLERARALLHELVEAYPEDPAAGQAWTLLGRLAVDRGDLDEAERALTAMARVPGEEWAAASREALGRVERLRWRRRVRAGCVAVWGLALLWLAGLLVWRVRAGAMPAGWWRRPPAEAVVGLLILAALVIWAWTGTHQTRNALLWMTGLVTPLLLANGWVLRAWSPPGWSRALWLVGLLVAWSAVVVASIGLAGMEGQVLHTLQRGTE